METIRYLVGYRIIFLPFSILFKSLLQTNLFFLLKFKQQFLPLVVPCMLFRSASNHVQVYEFRNLCQLCSCYIIVLYLTLNDLVTCNISTVILLLQSTSNYLNSTNNV